MNTGKVVTVCGCGWASTVTAGQDTAIRQVKHEGVISGQGVLETKGIWSLVESPVGKAYVGKET